MNEQRVQTSEALRVGLVLALAGGYLDAYTYLCRGGVFANAETRNMVLLGVKLAAGDWAGAAKYLPPIFAFFLGVLAAEAIRRRGKAAPAAKLHWRQWVLALEIGAVAAEWLCYRRTENAVRYPLLFSLCANAFSFCCGLVLQVLVF